MFHGFAFAWRRDGTCFILDSFAMTPMRHDSMEEPNVWEHPALQGSVWFRNRPRGWKNNQSCQMGMVKIKRPHVFFLQRSKTKWPNASGMFFVFLIRCANESLPRLTVWLKSSRHPIPHETSCLRFFFAFFFPGHVNSRSNASLVAAIQH